MTIGCVLLVHARICKCTHSAGYHKEKQLRGPDNSYAGKIYLECLMDWCDCQQFEQVKEEHVGNHLNGT